jgi:hypothetical protein
MPGSFNDFWNSVIGTVLLPGPAKTQIQSALQIIYNLQGTDSYAASIVAGLEAAATDPISPRKLSFFQTGIKGYSSNSTTYSIDVPIAGDQPVQVKAFNIFGQWISEPIYKTLAHELAHLILGQSDPAGSNPDAGPVNNIATAAGTPNLLGGAETVANSIAASQGDANALTASYFLADANNTNYQRPIDSFDPSVSYTFGNPITSGYWIGSVVRNSIEYTAGYTLDRSAFKENDLLIGGRGNDTIYGAQGNNYIYGNGGNDVIIPGTGNNVIDAGIPYAFTGASSQDIVDYSSPKRDPKNGITVDFSAQVPDAIKAADQPGQIPIIPVTDNGFGGQDYLLETSVLRMDTLFVDTVIFTKAAIQANMNLRFGLVIDSSRFTGDVFEYEDVPAGDPARGYVDFIPKLWTSDLENFGADPGKINVYIEPNSKVDDAIMKGENPNQEFDIGSWADIGSTGPGDTVLIEGSGGNNNIVRLQDVSGKGVELTVSTEDDPTAQDWLPDIYSAVHGDFALDQVQTVDLPNVSNDVSVNDLLRVTKQNVKIDAGSGQDNVLDFSKYSGSDFLGHSKTGGKFDVFTDKDLTQDTGIGFTDFQTLDLGNGNNVVELDAGDAKGLTTVNTGNGDDKIKSSVENLTINVGNGTDTIYSVGPGTVVNAGRGKDTFIVSNDELITGTGGNVNDVIADQGGLVLHGFVGPLNSDSPWITSIYDGTSYGINTQGDLVIKDTLGNETFVTGYVGGPNVPLSDQTDGIFVGRGQFKSSRLLDLKRPFMEQIPTIFKFGNEIWFARTGKPFFPGNDDPLVLDLTGAGVNLTGESEAAPIFDMQGTGFAVHTGWIQPNDAFLVMQTADGQIQLVGGNGSAASGSGFSSGTGATGFAALAQYDVNGDGVIDASDPIYSQLMIWQDANGNGVADPGELQTLAQAGITSISLNATASGATVAGNTIDPTATFTFANGTTGTIADVLLSIDPYNSKYLGNTTVSAAAAAMPNLKGYGTLTHQSFVTEPTNL